MLSLQTQVLLMKRERWFRLPLHWQTVCSHGTPKAVEFDLGPRGWTAYIMVPEVKQIFYQFGSVLWSKSLNGFWTQHIWGGGDKTKGLCAVPGPEPPRNVKK